MKTPKEILSEFVRLHDAGIRPQIVRGMLREELEWSEAMAEAREYVKHAPPSALRGLIDDIEELVGADLLDPELVPSLEAARNEVLR